MATYILRPKLSILERTAAAVSMPSVRLRSEVRLEQIRVVADLNRRDPVRKEIEELAASVVSPSRTPAASAGEGTALTTCVTGTTIVEMSDQEAEAVRKEHPNVAVMPDRIMELIRPNRVATAHARTKLGMEDRWHLQMVGVIGKHGKRKTAMTGKGIGIAVLDTGIDETHPELTRKVKAAFHFDTKAWQANQQPASVDTDGHGTHVAGLIAGKTTGVAPGVELISGMMIPGGRGSLSDFLLALEWAAQVPEIQIICMSAGIPGYVPELHDVIASLVAVGVLPVIAIGNEGLNRTRSPGNYPEVLSVGACDRDGFVPGFSSSGALVVDHHMYEVPYLLAPGKGVFSCTRGGNYEAWDGSSMATPIVAGVAALLLQESPNISIIDLVDELFNRAWYNDDEVDSRQGYGVVCV